MKTALSSDIAGRCPRCGASLAPDAPEGLCARCLLEGAAASTAAASTSTRPGAAPELSRVAAAFPQLEVLGPIGAGAMGAVYKARQPHLDRFVALKVLSESLASNPAFVSRFTREARLLARLNHPNIVTVHDYGQAGGFCFLVMEYVDGVNLRQAMRSSRFTPAQALAIVPKICEALQFAHEEGVLHRDIKPENILLDSRGRVKIADFGIAKLLGEARGEARLTASGAAVGTPVYMAPEQLEHPGEVDQRADIYSLGVVFYEMLTGELPLGRFAPPSRKTPVDPRVDEVVLRALEKEKERRFSTAGEMKTGVEAITQPAAQPRLATPVDPLAGCPGEAGSAASEPVRERVNAWPPDAARPATVAAVLTGLSVVLGVLLGSGLAPFAALLLTSHARYAVRGGMSVGWPDIALTCLLGASVVAVLAAVGVRFGLRARETLLVPGSLRRGTKRAYVGIWAWPVVLGMLGASVGLLAVSVWLALPGPPRVLLVLLGTLGAAELLLWRTWRWFGRSPRGSLAGPMPDWIHLLLPLALLAELGLLFPTAAVGLPWLARQHRPAVTAALRPDLAVPVGPSASRPAMQLGVSCAERSIVWVRASLERNGVMLRNPLTELHWVNGSREPAEGSLLARTIAESTRGGVQWELLASAGAVSHGYAYASDETADVTWQLVGLAGQDAIAEGTTRRMDTLLGKSPDGATWKVALELSVERLPDRSTFVGTTVGSGRDWEATVAQAQGLTRSP